MDSASCAVQASSHGSAIPVLDRTSNEPTQSVSRPLNPAATKIVDEFTVSTADLQKITDHFLAELRRGLCDASLPFQLPAFVTTIPTGAETGKFLSVDLGGTNCRICLVHLRGSGEFSVTQSKHAVPLDVMVNEHSEPLFSWIAARICEFVTKYLPSPDIGRVAGQAQQTRTPLGFTFSFTCDQTSLSSGTLIHWDKGWDIPAAIGCDPCRLLQDAIDTAGIMVEVVVLANDSVGTLLARAYTAASIPNTTNRGPSRTLASIIVGTGTNAAYIEQLSRIKRYPQPPQADSNTDSQSHVMVVNSEWGCWDDLLVVLPQTRFDADVDANSSNPGSQMFEKLASGMYLGELFRLAVCELVQTGGVISFAISDDSAPLLQRNAIDTSLLSALSDKKVCIKKSVALVSSCLGVQGARDEDIYILRNIAGSITTRAARLTAAALAAILIQCGYRAPTMRSTPNETMVSSPSIGGRAVSAAESPKSHWAVTTTTKILGAVNSVVSCLFSSCFPVAPSFWRETPQSAKPSCETSATASGEVTAIDDTTGDAIEIIDIGVTGSVIELHPTFETEMLSAIQELPAVTLDKRWELRTGLCSDGSAVGAALMAHAALCQVRKKQV